MTYAEALKYFKNNEEGKNGATKYLRCKKKAIEALEKQIPMKPMDTNAVQFAKNIILFGDCPNCKERMSQVTKFCYKCGQKLDWGNE